MSTPYRPDPDRIQEALDACGPTGDWRDLRLREAARAYLRMREEQQPAEPALTIEQVVAACNAARTGAAPAAREWHIYLSREEGAYRCHIEEFDRRHAEWRSIVLDQSKGDTPEAAIQQLGRDAIAKIKERHAADAAKLRELGVEP